MVGFYGKLPAHGDFITRNLPQHFVQPWDEWLQDSLPAIGGALTCPVLFHLPPAGCGPLRVAGVLIPSLDAAGRRFPLTIAQTLAGANLAPARLWYERLIELGETAREAAWPANVLAAKLEAEGASPAAAGDALTEGWWRRSGVQERDAPLVAAANGRDLLGVNG